VYRRDKQARQISSTTERGRQRGVNLGQAVS
jgi:hypothetical protein